ncbi:MAG TPA: GAF domain-containing protein, partial [Deinococcales bacterium]|nr:GAF domain-containing protein [Deinococcales bacterium]
LEASSVLSSSLDYQATLATVADLVVPNLADWCAIHVAGEDGRVHLVALAHVDPDRLELVARLQDRYPYDPNASGGVQEVFRTGEPFILPEITDQMLVDSLPDPDLLQIMRDLRICSFMAVPMTARERVLGVISFYWAESGRQYTSDDLAFAEDLAVRSALAVDNARLYREARQAVEDSARLQAVTAGLSKAVTELDVAEVILDQGLAAFDARAGLLATLQPGETFLRLLRSRGYEPGLEERWSQIPLDADVPAALAARLSEPVFIHSSEDRETRFPALGPASERHDTGAIMALPLVSDRATVGVVALTFDGPRDFPAGDRNLALAMARQCAQVLARARLFAEVQSLNADLERRVEDRTRELQARNAEQETFVYTVSHDLRAPLLSLEGMGSLLREAVQSGDVEESTFLLSRISANVTKMGELISDLLTLSRVGRSGEPEESQDLNEAVALAGLELENLFQQRNVRLQVNPNLPRVKTGRTELGQVITNLLTNAAKYAGGRAQPALVRVSAEPDGEGHVALVVADDGPGIAPEHAERVFGLFQKLDAHATGSGVGLSIVRRIAERLGGRAYLRLSGNELPGANFVVELPVV